MANRIDKAASWLGNPRAEKNAGKQSMALTTGTATSDSENGFVNIIVGDTTITENNDGQSVEIPTSVKVLEGDTVIITANGNDTIKTPIVSDVIGGGDRTQADIDTAAAIAVIAAEDAERAEEVAGEAKAAAEATNQHFFADGNGIHVSTAEGDATSGPNLLANSEGIMLRDGIHVMTAQTPSGFSVYMHDTSTGNADIPIATLGRITTIGPADGRHIHLDSSTFSILDNSTAAMTVGWLKIPDETFLGMYHYIPTFAFGTESAATGQNSFADSGGAASDENAHADSGGIASGIMSHADSKGSAEGVYSHASSGGIANQSYSSAFGEGSVSNTASGLACGRYNDYTNNGLLLVVGNGTSDNARSNALEIRDSGHAAFGEGISAKDDIHTSGNVISTASIQGQSLIVDGYVVIDTDRNIQAVKTIDTTGNITSDGMILDTPFNKTATRGSGIIEGSCTYTKTGHIVQVSIWAKLKNSLATYSTLNSAFTGLPKAMHTGTIGPFKMDGTTGTCFVQPDTNGNLAVVTRETAFAANGVFTGSAIYISSE